MEFLFGQVFHDVSERGFGTDGDAAESLGLSVGPVLVELDLQEVGDSKAGHAVGDVRVRRPPCQVADVNLESRVGSVRFITFIRVFYHHFKTFLVLKLIL